MGNAPRIGRTEPSSANSPMVIPPANFERETRPRAASIPRAIGRSKLPPSFLMSAGARLRSEEHTSELQSRPQLVCRLLLEKKNAAHRGGITWVKRPLSYSPLEIKVQPFLTEQMNELLYDKV